MVNLRKAFIRIYGTIAVMLKWPRLKNQSLQNRFLIRVLLPPFLILLLLSAAIFWLYNQNVREQALGGLESTATSTVIRLEREIAIRRTVLTRSGSELFELKNEFQNSRATLDSRREKCRRHIRQHYTYAGQEDGVCAPFIEELAALPDNSPLQLQVLEDSYTAQAKKLNDTQADDIARRLDTFAEFFPETLALLVVDKQAKVISEALADTEDFSADKDVLLEIAARSVEAPVEGEIITTGGLRQAVFAYPIKNGAVLAVYHLDHDEFIAPAIESATQNYSSSRIMLTAGRDVIYPAFTDGQKPDLPDISEPDFEYQDDKLAYSAYAKPVRESNWQIVAASPRSLVLAPVRDARLVALLLIGGALVTFLWLGTAYVQRQVRSIRRLVDGALVFSSNRLDHRIDLGGADQEYMQLAETMNRMAARIAEAETEMDRRNREFIDIATHELKAPMTGIIASLSLLLEEKKSKKISGNTKKMVDIAYGETIKLRDLVNDLLDVAMIEGGQAEFKEEPVDICRITEDVIETLKMSADENGIKLTHPCKGEVPEVMADSSKLQAVVTNLVSNAIKYNHSGGKIEISHVLKANMLVTSVSDDGLGIPADQQKHIFEKFFRVDTREHRHVEGTGLGMYTAKQYIEAMGGEVWFESEAGKGTTFSFSMPVAD